MSKNMTTCKACGKEISKKAKACPECGEKVKKPFYTRWWFWLIIAVLLVAAMSSGDTPATDDPVKVGTIDPAENTSTSAPATNIAAQTEFHVGDILQDGNMKIVYISSGEYTEDNEFSQPEDGYQYIFLQFAFENTSDSTDEHISIYNFECYADGYAAEMHYGGEDHLSATLSAGRSTTGYLYFCVPSDAKEIEIEYTTNLFLSDKIFFVYEGEKDSGYVPTINATASPNAYKVGDVVESSKLRITYLSCEEFISDNQFVQPKEGHRFVTCTFEFENLGKSDEHVSYFDFDCYADGINCDASYIRDDGLSATISSGRKAKGTVTFEVPIDATVIEVEYLSNYWTSNRVVFTVE